MELAFTTGSISNDIKIKTLYNIYKLDHSLTVWFIYC